MDNKLNNQDYTVVDSPEQSLSGNANKIKLKMISYAAILEVQAAFMEEEIASKQEEMTQIAKKVVSKKTEDKQDAMDRMAKISIELMNMKVALENLSDYSVKFMDMAKKALRLPNANLEELLATGKTTLDGEIVTKKDISKDIDISSVANLDNAVEKGESVLKTHDGKSVFNDIDPDEIRAQVEQVINSDEKDEDGLTFNDYVDNKIKDDENFDDVVNLLTEKVKDDIDDRKANPEVKPDDLQDIFNKEPEVEAVNDSTDTKESSSTIPTIDLSNIFGNSESVFNDTKDTFVEPEEAKDEKDDLKSADNDSSLFDDDKSMEEFIANLNAEKEGIKARIQDSKARGVELDNTNKGLDQELDKANTSLEAARRRKEIAEKRKKYFELAMPEVQELRAQEKEENKANSLKEQQIAEKQIKLDSTNDKTASYNQEADAIEKEVDEMIRKMQNPDGDGQLGGSGQKMKF